MSKIIKKGDLPQRKIQIKPVNWTNVAADEPEIDETEALVETENQLQEKQAELSRLEEMKQTKLAEIQSLIAAEKKNWEEEKQQWIEEAKKQGFEEGFKSGEEKSFNQYRQLLTEANEIVDLVKEDYQKTLERTEDVIIDLAIHTAEKILDDRLTEEPEDFIHIVEKALKEISDQPVISIYLHPKDYETVLSQKTELKRIVEQDTKLSLYINEELAEGSCVIEHPFGQIDASIDTQLGEVRNALRELITESMK